MNSFIVYLNLIGTIINILVVLILVNELLFSISLTVPIEGIQFHPIGDYSFPKQIKMKLL